MAILPRLSIYCGRPQKTPKEVPAHYPTVVALGVELKFTLFRNFPAFFRLGVSRMVILLRLLIHWGRPQRTPKKVPAHYPTVAALGIEFFPGVFQNLLHFIQFKVVNVSDDPLSS